MISKLNNISLIVGAPGIILQSAGAILTNGMKNENMMGHLFILAGSALLLIGFAFYAKAKGRSPAWCLMAFLSIVGLIVLATLTDKTKNINQPSQQNDKIGSRSPGNVICQKCGNLTTNVGKFCTKCGTQIK